MQVTNDCIVCRKVINGTYVTCTQCTFVRVCTKCHLNNTAHHVHDEKEQAKVTSISSSDPSKELTLAKVQPKKYKVMSRMMNSQSGRSSSDG